ncbi:MAG: VIT1/CCC1 transporter family protein [Candidatus Omnitrophica bacterium]|nr:VIT1/CCC1 transporter family protein [Candidatus Omnitrophota bacterium]
MLTDIIKQKILLAQRNEITEHIIYHRLSQIEKDKQRKALLERISKDEQRHYNFWYDFTNQYVEPQKSKILFFIFLARVFGLTFALKLLEKGEDNAQEFYAKIKDIAQGVQSIIQDEETHEKQLLNLIDEERLLYVSSIVLGLNDALVELTGALVGFSFALQNVRLVAGVGLITGVAASLSMAASEYLSTRQEDTKKNPLKASIYTGVAYIVTVCLLILPYLLFSDVYLAVIFLLLTALLIIFSFTYYVCVAKELSLKERFLEMASIGMLVSIINFGIGIAVRKFFGIEL